MAVLTAEHARAVGVRRREYWVAVVRSLHAQVVWYLREARARFLGGDTESGWSYVYMAGKSRAEATKWAAYVETFGGES